MGTRLSDNILDTMKWRNPHATGYWCRCPKHDASIMVLLLKHFAMKLLMNILLIFFHVCESLLCCLSDNRQFYLSWGSSDILYWRLAAHMHLRTYSKVVQKGQVSKISTFLHSHHYRSQLVRMVKFKYKIVVEPPLQRRVDMLLIDHVVWFLWILSNTFSFEHLSIQFSWMLQVVAVSVII